MKASIDQSRSRGATSSPTIIIGGRRYNGDRSIDSLVRGICYDDFPSEEINPNFSPWILMSVAAVVLLVVGVVVVLALGLWHARRRNKRVIVRDEEEEDEDETGLVGQEEGVDYQMVPVVSDEVESPQDQKTSDVVS